jgi:hypothetical protein
MNRLISRRLLNYNGLSNPELEALNDVCRDGELHQVQVHGLCRGLPRGCFHEVGYR